VAAALHGMGYGPEVPDRAGAKVELLPDGRFAVYAGVSDMGQGNAPTFLQIAAEVLGQPAERLTLVLPDTRRTLPSGSSSASRTTFTYGNALIKAAEALKTRILAQAAALLSDEAGQVVALDELELRPGRVRHRSGGELALERLAAGLPPEERLSTATYTAPVSPERVGTDPALRQWGLPHTLFFYAAHLAAVEVDRLTGETRVDHYLACTEGGGVLNPQLYEQQVQGGVAQGLGYALFEDFRCEGGRIRTPNLTTYILPTAADVPDVASAVVPGREPEGPFGMRGIGEIVIDPVCAAVSNALADAVGKRLREAPYTAERVLAALPENRTTTEAP
jgi:CO/xanthine dehydrogenase Mo-binding subunit